MGPKAKMWAGLAVSAGVQCATQLVALGVLSGTARSLTEVAGAVLTTVGVTLGVYQVPNGQAG